MRDHSHEDVRPTEQEMSVWNDIDKLLQKKDDVINKLNNYQGKDEFIRKAIASRTDISDPAGPLSPEEEAAWKEISVQAVIINEFYQFAVSLGMKQVRQTHSPRRGRVSKTHKGVIQHRTKGHTH